MAKKPVRPTKPRKKPSIRSAPAVAAAAVFAQAAAEKPILYVKAGVTAGWREMFVFDLRQKKYVRDVAEANAQEGWYDQAVRNADGTVQTRGAGWVCRRVRAPIRIDRRTPR